MTGGRRAAHRRAEPELAGRGRETTRRPRIVASAVLILACAAWCAPGEALAATPLSWSEATPVDTGALVSAVACPSESLCVAVDRSGRMLFTRNPTSSTPSWSKPAEIGSGQPLTAVACGGEDLCVAVDEGGSAAASTNPASGAGAWHASKIDGVGLTGVSCASASLCVAVDSAGNALTSTDPGAAGAAWTSNDIDAGTGLRGVSCPSESLCATVDATGDVLVDGDPASPGSGWGIRTIDPTGTLTVVSCASASLCVALDSAGNAFASADAGSPAPTWNSTQVDVGATPTAISCATSGLCVLLDSQGNALASDNPTAAVPAWSGSAAEPGAAMATVSCLPGGLCSALDGAGRALTGVVAAPASSSGAAVEVSATEATLTGTVDPHDAVLSGCRFEYGPTASYGQSAACASTPSPTAGAQAVQVRASGLAGSSTYHFRVTAANIGGTGFGTDHVLTTAAPIGIVTPHPSIAGVPGVGERLHCLPGVPSTPSATLTYAWIRDASAIAHAEGSTFVVATADAKHHLQCRVTATDAAGRATGGSGFVSIPAAGVLAAVGETKVGRIAASATAISMPVSCSSQASGGCAIAVRVTTLTRAHKSSKKLTVSLAGYSTRLKRGEKRTVAAKLSASGRRLLAHSRRLTAKVSVSGTVIGAITAKLASATLTLRSTSGHGH